MKKVLQCLFMISGLLLGWHVIVTCLQLPDYILPSPIKVLITLYQQFPLIVEHTIPTMIEIIFGFLLGILFGCMTALMLAFFPRLSIWFLPVLILSQAIPTFAIAPLIVIWLGYGLVSKIAVTVLMIFFPITSAFYDGLRQTETGWLDLAKTMNGKTWRIFCSIKIPAALSKLSSGIRIAAVVAPIGAIVGEWVGSRQGLGYLMLNANARLQIDQMFAALMIIILLSLTLYFSVDWTLRKIVWWS